MDQMVSRPTVVAIFPSGKGCGAKGAPSVDPPAGSGASHAASYDQEAVFRGGR